MICTLPNTHRKLLEIHRLWHQCITDYFDPEGFRTNLNATIQAIRNLTFALQAESKASEGFNEWYLVWQDKMKNDSIMKWLNDARVSIVHQRDLETKSLARVRIHAYYDLAEFELEVYPFLRPESIVKYAKEKLVEKRANIPANQISDCVAVVERKWVANDLPDWELLNVIKYAYYFLYDLVRDAHVMQGADLLGCSIQDNLHAQSCDEISTGRLLCMEEYAQKIRTDRVLLSDFSTVKIKRLAVKRDEGQIKKAIKRYSLKPSLIGGMINNTDFLSYAENLYKVALEVLKRDKYHGALFFTHIPEKGWQIHSANAEDKTHKFLIMQNLAEYVRETKCDCIIDIHEIWVTNDVESIKKGLQVSETIDRREALQVSVFSLTNLQRVFVTFFRRNIFGNIILEESIIYDDAVHNYLAPIQNVWKQFE